MRRFKNILFFETKILCNHKTFIIMFVFLLLAFLIIQQSITRYSSHMKQCGEFQELESRKTMKYVKSIQSGLIGIRLFNSIVKRTPVAALFYGSSLFDTLHSTVDNSGVLIDNVSKNSKNIPEKRSSLFSGLSLYIMFVLGFLAALLGLFGTCDKKRLKFLLNMGNRFSVSAGLFLSRMFYIILTLTLLIITVFLCFLAKGIQLNGVQIKLILIHSLVSAVILAIFLLAGLLGGLTKTMFKGVMVVAAAWITILFILPGVLNAFFINPLIENMKSVYENDTEKFEILNRFENMVKEKVKNSKSSEWKQLAIDMNKQFLDEEYEKIKKLETAMIGESKAVVKKICFINMFTPGTFYESVSREMTVGYRALLDFHRFNFAKQLKIVEFYIKSYFDKSVKVPDIPVAYQLKNRLPYYSKAGLLLNMGLVILAFALFYGCFLKAVFPCVRKNFEGVKIKAKKGDYFLLNLKSGSMDFSNKIFNLFFKPKREDFAGEITVDDRSIADLKVFYLPDMKEVKPGDLRLLTGGDAEDFKKKAFVDLDYTELTKLLPQIEKSDILFIDNAGISVEPQDNIVVLELDSRVTFRKYTKMHYISLNKDAFEMKVSKDNSRI